ncbi:DUF488 family protein [Actinocrinis puniceicyclus]|uniref:DUF488 family protein n=1 Tax=Actinocrinis puniceicyclus TaxID=977794 RepID=A0A8J7WW04_9ACTN|nr:DUF488 family protein [Actinocrinis puniceicyclus]MBS2966917.1 DUF488 family protein [Actinocrinis puniceicyclus]
MKPKVKIGRVYDETPAQDGMRVLVDRVWPRGMKKESAHLDQWAKQVAPSTQLRTWYAHDPAKFAEFRRRYSAELDEPERAAAFAQLRELAREKPLMLLTATRDLEHSQAAVLAEKLR